MSRREPYGVLLAGFLLHLLLGVPYAYGLLRPSFEHEFGLSELQAALPFSAILLAYTVGMVLGGPLVDRVSAKVTATLGVLLFGVGFASASFAPSLAFVLAGYGAVCGLGIGLAYMAAVTTAVHHFPGRRGMATGAVVLGFGLSSAALSPVVQGLLVGYGWRTTLLAMGCGFLVLGLPLALTMREAPTTTEPEHEGPAPWRQPVFWWLWWAWALAITVGLGWLGQIPELARERGFGPSTTAGLVAVVSVTNGLGRPALGWLSDRVGRFGVLWGGCALGGLGLGLALFVESAPIVWVSGLLIGLAFGSWLVNLAPMAADVFGEASLGRAYGALFTAYGVGALVGPLSLGALHDASGSDRLGLAASMVVLGFAAIAFAVARRSAQRPQPVPS